MKQRAAVLVLAAVLALPDVASSQQPKVERKSAPLAEEAQLMALEQAAHAALVRGDANAFSDVVGGPFLFLNPSGTGLFTPEVVAESFKRCRTASSVPSNVKATRSGSDVMLVTSDVALDQVCGEARGLPVYRAMSVWQRLEGRWRLVAHSQTPPPPAALTPEAKAAIEQQVRAEVERMVANARVVNAEGLLRNTAKQDGLCLFAVGGAKVMPCSEAWAAFRKQWSPDNPNREARQELDEVEIRALALSPTVAIGTMTTAQDRAYAANGQLLVRAPVAALFVFVLEDGQWRLHSAHQAAWPGPLASGEVPQSGAPVAPPATLASASSGAGTAKPCDEQGVWELVSGTEDGVAGPPGMRQRKIITRGHWAWVRGEGSDAKLPVTRADTLAAQQLHLGGAGTYTLRDSTYTEKIDIFPGRAYEGMSIPFTCRIVGDRLYQSGTFPILLDGKRAREVHVEEVYQRVE